MLSPREHVERIRRERYFIGRGEKNPLAEDMHQAVNYLSQELYSKDVHFLMELVQNAEDNEYPSGVAPSLEFIITSKDITRSGASSTLLVFNNEKGFGPENIESICRIGKSTKKGNRKHGYIGEKGIGFKSVFLVSSKPHIFSNGYQIKFDEEPSAECGVGYIVPNWVEETPTLSDIFKIYGSSNSLPTTVIILPIKSGKIDAVKEELLSTHPEILLFLSKIRQLSVREIDGDLSATSVSHICISSEADALTRKDIGTESCTLHLSAQEDETGEHQCSYYIWKQHFPVKPECQVQRRAGVEEWVIMLAFPHGQRLSQEAGWPGVFAFLPTAMATNFPFIIQADFLLSSSRESILLDNLWNRGILDYVPFAFRNAFVALVKSTESAPVFALAPVFKFLPVHRSPVPLLDSVRLSIRNELVDTDIVPCETCSALKLFCKPTDVGRLDAAFWSILNKAAKLGAELPNISSHGIHILSSYFDNEEYNDVLAFLGISYVDVEWYAKCIRGSNLAVQLPEEVYVDLLAFVAENWCVKFVGTNMEHVLFIKCVGPDGEVSYRSVEEATTGDEKLCMVSDEDCVSSLINWNKEFFSTISRLFFMPLDTQKALEVSPEKATVMEWLQKYVCMKVLTLHDYVLTVAKGLHEKRQVLAFTRFVYQLHVEKYIPEWTLQHICSIMPIVNTSGHIITGSRVVLSPAKGSKWAALMGKNPWTAENYVDLAEDYLSAVSFAGFHVSEDHLLSFLKIYMQSTDVPFLHPPDAGFSAVSCPLRMESALILSEWIQNLRLRGVGLPKKFLSCVMHGSWLKTYVGYRPPSESFLSNGQWGSLFQNQPAFVDIPMIDQDFYENKIAAYNEELGAIGVRFKLEEAMAYIGKRFMSMAIGDTPIIDLVFSLLQFIRHLRQHRTSPHHLIQSIRNGRWLKTCLGYRCPIESILFTPEWSVPSQISTLPFIDIDFYGEDIADYKSELGLLGVLINFKQNYQIVVDNFNFPKGSVTADGAVLMLKCIRYADSCKNFVKGLKKRQWLKTSVGFRAPRQTFLLDPEWKCLLKFVDMIALLDLPFYGDELLLYREELRRTGLIVSLEEASKAITCHLKHLLLTSSLTKEIRIVLLSSYRELNREHRTFPADLLNFMRTEKWLHTSHGFRSPKKCILFDATWEPLVPVASLPFIDDSDTQNGAGKEIYSYKTELKALGAIVEFNQGSDLVRSGLTINAGHSLCVPINVISRVSTIADLQSSHARGSPHAVRRTRETTDGNMQASSVAENISLLVTPSSLYSLLKCMQNSIDPESFADRIRKMPMKTTVGHRYADECILFDATWSSYLRKEDGPFIDEAFYGPEILSYKTELRLIGVILDVCSGCPLMAQHLKHHSEVARLSRIYRYLALFKWEPRNKTENWIWIPSGSSRGQWARSTDCVLHDKNSLFDKRFHALDKYYDKDLLAFFSMVLGVKHGPRVLDHFTLWRSWECTSSELTPPNCSAFWEFIGNRWNAMTEKLMLGCVTKVPVLVGDKIILSDVQDVFVPDDLLLKDLFDNLSAQPIFVWYPSTRLSFTLRARMDTIYRSVGVRAISKAAVKDESFMLKARCCQVVQERRTVVTPGLLRVILAFLADPTLGIATEKRHQMVSCLLGVTVLETEEPITMSYRVALSSGRMAVVKASRMFRWERESYKMYMQKAEAPLGKKTRMELATCFAEEISQGLLYERVDLVLALTELVKLGFLVDFEEAEVEFLLKTKNLQLFSEDAGLLSNSELANRCCF